MLMTKIVVTLGPASNDTETIKRLIKSGMNVARINFSHGNYKTHGELIEKLKTAREELKAPVALMLDTKGPEIRIKTFKENKIYITQGNTFTLTTQDVEGDENRVSITYKDLPKDLSKNSRVLLDDGLLELKVKELTDTDIVCEAINSGFLSSNKGMNIPDVYVNLPALTEKDVEDIKFGIKNDFDFIAASFVRTADDVVKIKEILEANNGNNIKIIAKIESRDGVNNIESILEIADGIMVARGDLGVEIPPEEVPLVQKLLIKKANNMGKPVITATQMLESMVNNLRPTRAEANDVANSIFDGSDAVMLSGETAQGAYPVESVRMMARIAAKTESDLSASYQQRMYESYKNFHANITNSISFSACTISSALNGKCIATVTNSGFTARMVSRFRPICPILAITKNKSVWRQLSLTWGCLSVLSDKIDVHDETFSIAEEEALATGLAKSGDTVVIAAGIPVGIAGTTNTLKVKIVGDVFAKGKGFGDKIISGESCVIKSLEEANKYFKTDDIIVTSKITKELLPFIKRASGLVVGSWLKIENEKAKMLSLLIDIPVVVCQENIVDVIPNTTLITIDSIEGIIYNGSKS